MEFKLKEKVIVKLFIGCLVDPPLKHLLIKSPLWKEALIDPKDQLVLVPFENKEYLGTYVSSPAIGLDKLHFIDEEVKRKVLEYCPKYKPNTLQTQIFSQVFIL